MAKFDYINDKDVKEKLEKRYMDFIKNKMTEDQLNKSLEEVKEESDKSKEGKKKEKEEVRTEEDSEETKEGREKMKVTVYE
ncbi:MAG: hypothetical protein ABEK36_00105 [Candidatus Aenigmatarchaeota archaeon]